LFLLMMKDYWISFAWCSFGNTVITDRFAQE